MRAVRAIPSVVALLLFTTSAPCAAADGDDQAHPRAYVDIDFTLLNVGASVAGHVGHGVYVGAGFSVLPAIAMETLHGYAMEVADAHAFVRYEPARFLDLDAGMRVSYVQDLDLCIFAPCSPPATGALFGPYAAVAIGWPHFKLGPRLEFAERSDTKETGLVFFPVILRVAITP